MLCLRPFERGTVAGPFLDGGKIGLDRFPQRLGVLVAFGKQHKRAAEMMFRGGPIERRLLATGKPECAMVDFDGEEDILAGAEFASVLA